MARAELFGRVDIRSQVRRDEKIERRQTRADTSVVTYRGGQMVQLDATGSVEVSIGSGQGGVTRVGGQVVRMTFSGQETDSLAIEGKATVVYTPAGGKALSRLSGNEISLWLLGGKIHRALIVDEAVCEHTGSTEEAHVVFSGDRLELLFEDGELSRASGKGGVRGNYAPAEEETSR